MEKSQFLGANKKPTWTNMQMGALNASLVVGIMMTSLQQECQVEVEHHNIRYCGLELIIDTIVFF